MADPKNTGPGGFDIDGRTYTFDVGVPESQGGDQGIRQKTVDVSGGYLDSSGNPKDLTKKTKATLSQYLSDVTNGKKGGSRTANKYPISANNKERNLSEKNGNPTGPTPVAEANSTSFGGAVNPYTSAFPDLSPHLRKGKETPIVPSAVDGNDFLRNKQAGERPDTTPLDRYQSSVLKSNRFTAAQGQRFGDASSGAAGFNPGLSNQRTKGTYDLNAPSVTTGRLASIGPLLTMRAGKELNATSAGANPNNIGLQAAALLPGVAQLGLARVEQQVLLASDVLQQLTSDELDNVSVINPNQSSWGQLNNADDPWSGTNALGMLALSTALVAGVTVLFDGLSVLLGLITPGGKIPARDAQGRYNLGEYYSGTKDSKKSNAGGIGGAFSALTSLNFSALLGIQPTNYPFSRALTTGINAFFGLPDSKGGSIGLNQLAGALKSSADSPGFNAVVCRAIIRSGITVADQLSKIGGNPLNAINQTLSLIDTIRNSKLISACNIFATLGDAVLSNPKEFVDNDSAKNRVSTMDAVDDTFNAVAKNRLKGTLKLAWASNRAPAQLLLPGSIFADSLSVKNMGQFGFGVGARLDPYSEVKRKVTSKDDMGRIKPEEAYAFEDALEASYVPFYFHDVRTNEMISFHAFLASLTDDYTANYEKSEGFGRVESVKIYKSTERRINLSFYIVATSPQDFDEMYLKINKLVTLVYPQYTSGVQIQDKNKDYIFTQPFSQLVGASPLVRIRLGDLLRSNYTLFALGRLFGMGNPTFKAGNKFKTPQDVNDDALRVYENAIKDLLQNPDDKEFIPAAGPYSYEYIKDDGGSVSAGGISVSIPIPKLPVISGGDAPKYAALFHPGGSPYGPSVFKIKVKKIHPDNPYKVIGEVQFNDSNGETEKKHKGAKKYVEKWYNNPDNPTWRVIGGTYVFPLSALLPAGKTQNDLAKKIDLQPDGDFNTALAAFLSPQNNAIAKSFQDTGGKGLAGFIETMNFDWYDKVTWEVDQGRRAPKMCKVTISFSPVHDISPGIDHHGFNRAPVYPVGAMAQSEMPYQKVDDKK